MQDNNSTVSLISSSSSHSNSQLERKKEDKVKSLQNLYRQKRNSAMILALTGCDIQKQSEMNYRSFRAKLAEASKFVTQCIEPSSSKTTAFTDELSHYEQTTHAGLLTEHELLLFKYIIQNLTIQTATTSLEKIQKNGNKLLSPMERQRRGEDVRDCRSPHKDGRADQIYFVTGIGQHPNVENLRESYTTSISVNLNQLGEKDAKVLDSLWVSPHVSDVITSNHSEPVLLGNTRFQFAFDSVKETITYTIERLDEDIKLKWVVHVNDLVFSGKHVLPGLAYQFILLLRLIGGPYRKHILDSVRSVSVSSSSSQGSSLTQLRQLQIISVAMTSLMPGWMTCEAKIPVMFDLNKDYISVVTQADIDKFQCVDRAVTLAQALKAELEKELHKLRVGKYSESALLFIHDALKKGDRLALSSDKKLNRAIIIVNSIRQLRKVYSDDEKVEYGLGLNRLVRYRMEEIKDMACFDFLMSFGIPNQIDSMVRHVVNVNSRSGDKRANLLMEAVSTDKDDPRVAELLIKHGADIYRHGVGCLMQAIQSKNYKTATMLLNYKFEHQTIAFFSFGFNPLVACIMAWNDNCLGRSYEKINDDIFANLLVALVKAGYSINGKLYEITPLDFFMSAGNYAGVKLALSLGADVSESLWSKRSQPLPIIAEYHRVLSKPGGVKIRRKKLDTKIVSLLLENKVSILSEPEEIRQYAEKINFSEKDFQSKKYHYPLKRRAVVIMVTGVTPKTKQPYVILGKHRSSIGQWKKGNINHEYIFPGGLVDNGETFTDAAVRELREETGVNLSEYLKNGSVKAEEYYQEKVDGYFDFNPIVSEVCFIHFDVGQLLTGSHLFSQDDFISAEKVRISSLCRINKDLCFYNGSKVRQSNAFLLFQILRSSQISQSSSSSMTSTTLSTVAQPCLKRELEYECYLEEFNGVENDFLKVLRGARKDDLLASAYRAVNAYLKDPEALLYISHYWSGAAVILSVLYPNLMEEPDTLAKLLITGDVDLIRFLAKKKVAFNKIPQELCKKIAEVYLQRGLIKQLRVLYQEKIIALPDKLASNILSDKKTTMSASSHNNSSGLFEPIFTSSSKVDSSQEVDWGKSHESLEDVEKAALLYMQANKQNLSGSSRDHLTYGGR